MAEMFQLRFQIRSNEANNYSKASLLDLEWKDSDRFIDSMSQVFDIFLRKTVIAYVRGVFEKQRDWVYKCFILFDK